MGKWRRMGLGVLLLMLLGIILYPLLPPKEPTYQGQPLSFWLQQYRWSPGARREILEFLRNDRPRVDAAIRGIGPKAIPTLLRILRAKDSKIWTNVIAFVEKHSGLKIKHTPAETQHMRAGFAFKALGPDAKEAVPELIRLYNRNSSPSSFTWAAQALAAIGPAAQGAIPSVMRTLTNSNASMRSDAVQTLGCIHSQPKLVVPALLPFLSDANLTVRLDAVMAVEQFGTNAQAAAPVLVGLVNQPYPIGPVATRALKQIDPEAAARAGVQ